MYIERLKYLGVVICLAAGMTIVGCGGDDDDDGGDNGGDVTPPAASVTGTWRGHATGNVAGTSLNAPTQVTLTQNGASVTGTWDGYTVSGTFDGTNLSLTIEPFVQSGVSFTGSITATYSGGNLVNMNGSLTGRLGSTTVSGTFSSSLLTRTARSLGAGMDDGGIVDAVILELLK